MSQAILTCRWLIDLLLSACARSRRENGPIRRPRLGMRALQTISGLSDRTSRTRSISAFPGRADNFFQTGYRKILETFPKLSARLLHRVSDKAMIPLPDSNR